MNNKYLAEPLLEKSEVIKVIIQFLKENSYTQIAAIRNVVMKKLSDQKIIGTISESYGMVRETYDRRISDKDALLINECIYDLLYNRTITPSCNADNLELPFVHVSNKEKLEDYL